MSDDLLTSLESQIAKTPRLTAANLAKKLNVTRKEVNSLLYRHNKKLFVRIDNGEKAPTWTLLDKSETGDSKKVSQSGVSRENPSFQIVSKLIDLIEFQLGATEEFEAILGSIKFQVFLSSEGVNAKYARYELVEKDNLIIVINSQSIMSSNDLNSIGFHVLHCIADCISSYKLTLVNSSETDYSSIKNLIFNSLLSLNLKVK